MSLHWKAQRPPNKLNYKDTQLACLAAVARVSLACSVSLEISEVTVTVSLTTLWQHFWVWQFRHFKRKQTSAGGPRFAPSSATADHFLLQSAKPCAITELKRLLIVLRDPRGVLLSTALTQFRVALRTHSHGNLNRQQQKEELWVHTGNTNKYFSFLVVMIQIQKYQKKSHFSNCLCYQLAASLQLLSWFGCDVTFVLLKC